MEKHMAGLDVNRNLLDMRAADAVLQVRNAFDRVESVAKWLVNTPSVEGVDPLVADFGYTEDEAYLIRYVFETLENLRVSNAALSETARKLTGLE